MDEQEEKKELIEAAKRLPAREIFNLTPRTFEEAYRYANFMAESDVIPKDFQKKPANVLVAVQLGMELGVSPMQALQNLYVVNGRPAIFGDLLPAIVFQSGLMEQFDEQGDDKTASCTVKRKGFAAITRTFTWEDAKRAKAMEYGKVISLAEKQTYQSYPKRMLQMRARAWALRDAFPDVLKGVAVREEMEDIVNTDIETTATREPPIGIPQPKAGAQPQAEPEKPKTGRPAGSKNKPKETASEPNVQSQQTNPPVADGDNLPPAGGTRVEEVQGDDPGSEGQEAERAKEDVVEHWTAATLPWDRRLELFIAQATDEELSPPPSQVSFFDANLFKIKDIERKIALCELLNNERKRRKAK